MEKPLLKEGHTAKQAHEVPLLKYASLLVFLVGSCGSAVSLKRTTYAANFPAALTQLSGTVGLFLYSVMVLLGLLSRQMKLAEVWVPPQKPLVVALLFALHHTLMNVGAGGAAVPGLYVAVLLKFSIPMSMALNMYLGVRYTLWHWLSFGVVTVGIYFTVHGGSLVLQPGAPFKMMLIIVSIIPMALAFAYVERILKREHPHLWGLALWTWICLFMTLSAFVFLPLSAWLSGEPVGHKFPLKQMENGLKCYVLGTQPEGMEMDCGVASRFYMQGMIFEVMMNLGMSVSTRYAGATLMWFVKALTTPLAGICFALPLFMGEHAMKFAPVQVLGVLIVTSGVFLFDYQKQSNRTAEARAMVWPEGKEAVSDGATTTAKDP